MLKVAVEPDCWRRQSLVTAVEAGGGNVASPDEAEVLVWAEPARADLLPPMLDENPNIGVGNLGVDAMQSAPAFVIVGNVTGPHVLGSKYQ